VRTSTCLVELVLSAGEFGPQAEPALRRLRAALEAEHPEPVSVEGVPAGPGPVLRTGMAVTQEFGKLDITLRALVTAADLLAGATLGAAHLRAAVAGVEQGGSPDFRADFREQSVRASWT
jgi:hypothetical protein